MSESYTRRRLLVATGVGMSTALAGCAGSAEDETDDSSPTTDANEGTGESTGTDSGTDTDSETATSTPRQVSFESSAGTTVEGTLYGSGSCGVVLVPQINMDRESWAPQAERLAERGWVALAIDEGEKRVAAVRAAVGFLIDERGLDKVVVMGASTGGEAAVVAAAKEGDRVDGVVSLSAAGGAKYASELTGRKLFVASKNDEDRFVRIAKQLHEKAPDPKRLELYAGSAHGQGLFESSHKEELWTAVLDLVETVCEG